jgi:hypothetical protein
MRPLITIAIFLFGFAINAIGQACNVKFIVVDNYTKERIPGVRIVYKNSGTCYTDRNGECLSGKIERGERYFTFEKAGYETLDSYMIFLEPDTTVTQPSVELTREPFTRGQFELQLNSFVYVNLDFIKNRDSLRLNKTYDTSFLKFINETLVLQYERNNNKRGLKEFQLYIDTAFKRKNLAFIKKEDF